LRRWACATQLWLAASLAFAAPEAPPAGSAAPPEVLPGVPVWPIIRAIEFSGNETTRPEVMLREMVVKVGDYADPDAIERSRQGIQDLGLFRSVTVDRTELPDGVKLTFAVREKWYVIPAPRYDANSEGESAHGASLRWYNFDGRNHTLRAHYLKRDYEREDRGESTNYGASYSMPFVRESPYSVSVSAGRNETPFETFGGYTRAETNVGVGVTRAFGNGPASTGWSGGLFLAAVRESISGTPSAPEAAGHATVPGISVGFRDMRNHIYSDEGVVFGADLLGASESLASEYSFLRSTAYYTRALLVGPHQNWNFHARTGTAHGGPIRRQEGEDVGEFELGGTGALRAYPSSFVRGDFFYLLGTEYLRPLGADWLRGVVILEAGNAFEDANAIGGKVYSSIGLGLRVRFNFLVDVEVEAGFAWPIGEGDRRFFASRV
jgi:outer membrane protein assembly factor BamA